MRATGVSAKHQSIAGLGLVCRKVITRDPFSDLLSRSHWLLTPYLGGNEAPDTYRGGGELCTGIFPQGKIPHLSQKIKGKIPHLRNLQCIESKRDPGIAIPKRSWEKAERERERVPIYEQSPWA